MNGKGAVLAADESCQLLLKMLIGRHQYVGHFNGKTNNIGRPTNEIDHTDLSFLVVPLWTAVFFLSSA